MEKRPFIGIFSAERKGTTVLPVFRTTAHYVEQIAAAGGAPIQIPLIPSWSEADMLSYIDCCDGFVFPGGGDFDPGWYGEELLPNLKPDDWGLDREIQEKALAFIRLAAKKEKPMLGICLGMQVINIAFGGKLYQDIPTQIATDIKHSNKAEAVKDRWSLVHTVSIEKGSLLHDLTDNEEIDVNSFHHQAVKETAPGFKAIAWAPDGVIEAMENDAQNILTVQWHPENLAHAGMAHAKALFKWLVEKSSK